MRSLKAKHLQRLARNREKEIKPILANDELLEFIQAGADSYGLTEEENAEIDAIFDNEEIMAFLSSYGHCPSCLERSK